MDTPAPAALPRLRVVTREIEPLDDLLPFTTTHDPLFWSRRGDTMAAFGTVHTLRATGAQPAAELSAQWRALVAAAEVDDAVGVAGTGLIAFGSLAFDAASPRGNALIVPDLVVGRRGGRTFATRVALADAAAPPEPELPPRSPFGPHWAASLGPGRMTAETYQEAVRTAVAAIRAQRLDKVVLARDVEGRVPATADLRRLVRALLTGYPDCWVFAVDGLIGASPETLVTVSGGTLTARVLAGTSARGADEDADAAAALALADSAKDQHEHRFAVRSVLASLRPHTSALAAGEQPFTLRLPNVWHLATDIEGVLADRSSSLDLVAALHPTAAVAGTPTAEALEWIRRLEPFDRGRYAGAVGWIDADGDGEWAIALRCAQFGPATDDDQRALTAYAGAGIVADSDPEAELLETRVKFRPIIDALA
ncbi:isochorismate synthase [Microbacterium sp. 10M-3C3]|uniref:isochorismate synthase n=1 Tax=Microbacterium sp. 10M-3C3 TaxID=2483401 RepID=UPI001F0B9685|nr:isochorismate synthase [Microbacterium sp. 10M-3C3]